MSRCFVKKNQVVLVPGAALPLSQYKRRHVYTGGEKGRQVLGVKERVFLPLPALFTSRNKVEMKTETFDFRKSTNQKQ